MNNLQRAFSYSVFIPLSPDWEHKNQLNTEKFFKKSSLIIDQFSRFKRAQKHRLAAQPVHPDYYWNFCFDKGRIKNYVSWFLLNNGEHQTVALLDRLKTIGFSTATKAGISLGIDDLKIPPKKLSLLYQANVETELANQKYKRGDVLEVERFQRLISSWHRVSEVLKTEVVRHFEETNTLNPVYMMAFSGARGNISQVRQLVGMRGLMADPQGRIIDFPILSNFREGLTLTEYLISCYGARKGIVDTALRTANAGYLTRRLVDVAHHVIVSTYDCGTLEGVALTPMKEGNKLIYSLQNRLIGRVLAETIIKDGKVIAERNQELSHDLASLIATVKSKVAIRSPLTCASKNLVCQLCYGWSLADGRLVSIGEAVGIIAAQSIGEPGTQLTMRTFHTGGVFSSDVSDQIKAPYDAIVLFPEPILGTLVRTPEGDVVFLTKVAGEFMLQNINNETQFTKYKIPAFTLLFSRHKQQVSTKSLVAQITGVNQQTAQRDDAEQLLLSELEGQIYFASLRLRKYKKIDQAELKQNKLEVWTAPVTQTTTRSIDGFLADSKTKSTDFFDFKREKNSSYQSETNSIGLVWLLSGKIYQYPTKTVSFLQIGDLVHSSTLLNEIIWYTQGETLTALPLPRIPMVNTLTSGLKPETNSLQKATLSYQQSGIRTIQYKDFGYCFTFNSTLFQKFSSLTVSNYCISLSSALTKMGSGNAKEGRSSRQANESKEVKSISSVKTSLLQSTMMIYSRKTQAHLGGRFLFEDDYELVNQLKRNSMQELLMQLQQILFTHQQNSQGENESQKKQFEFFNVLQWDEPFFREQLNMWLIKRYFLQKHLIVKKQIIDSSVTTGVEKHYFLHKKINKSTTVTSNKSLTLRIANSHRSENPRSAQSLPLNKPLRSVLVRGTKPEGLNAHNSLAQSATSKLLWIPEEHYLITGNYSNRNLSLLGVSASTSRQQQLNVLQIPALFTRQAKRVLYLYKSVGKKYSSSLFNYSSKNSTLFSASSSQPTLKKGASNQAGENSLVSCLQQRFLPNKQIMFTHPYTEVWTAWCLLKTTVSVNNLNIWVNSTKSPFLKLLNRQGFSKNLSSRSGIVHIEQKYSMVPGINQIAKKGYRVTSKKTNELKQQVGMLNLYKGPESYKNEVRGINLHQQTHNYNIHIRQGFIYQPLNPLESLTLNEHIIKPGIAKLDDLIFSNHVLIEFIPASSLTTLEAYSTVTTGSSPGVNNSVTSVPLVNNPGFKDSQNVFTATTNSKLSRFKWSIKNPNVRYQPTIATRRTLSQGPLLVLLRPVTQIQQENRIMSARVVTELFRQSASTTLNTKVLNRLGYYTNLYNKQAATGNKGHVQNFNNKNSKFANSFKSRIKLTSQNLSEFNQNVGGLSQIGLQYSLIFETGDVLIHFFLSSNFSLVEQINCNESFNYSANQLKEQYVYNNLVMSSLQSNHMNAVYKLKQPTIQRLVNPCFSKTFKLKLQTQMKLYSNETFFNTLILSHLRDNSGSVETRKVIAENIFTKFKQKKDYETGIVPFNNIEVSISQPYLSLTKLNEKLSSTLIGYDLRPWYSRGFFHYTLSELSTVQRATGTRFLRESKVTQHDLSLPQEFRISQEKLLELKQLGLGSKYSLVTKLLNGIIVNVLQPSIFQKLTRSSFYFMTPQPVNFTPLHVSFTSHNYNPMVNLVNSTVSPLSVNGTTESKGSILLKSRLPGNINIGFNSSIDSKMFLKRVKPHVSGTKSLIRLPKVLSLGTNCGVPFPIARTSCFSPFNGEILSFVQNPTKSQLLMLTSKDLVALAIQKQQKTTFVQRRFKPNKHLVGKFIKFGDLINSDDVTTVTGSIIHRSQTKLTVRRSQYIAASHKAVLHVKNNDWIEKNVPLVTLPFQRLKAGDIVQGIPKIEQYFEARKSKAGRFYRDSIPNLMNAIFNEYLTRYRLLPFGTTTAAKKAILKVQQILLNGIQRVYRTQGVSIADKHIEIIVRQMTSKVRILNPGLSSFLPGELVDVHLIVELNRYLEQEIQFEPIVLGITQASLEVDSFISASSFQQTTRVLSEAALDKKRDYLRGLKENVILGNLMPAGTGHHIQ